MSTLALSVILVCYLGAAIDLAVQGDWRMSGLFVCYAMSNVFLIAATHPVRAG